MLLVSARGFGSDTNVAFHELVQFFEHCLLHVSVVYWRTSNVLKTLGFQSPLLANKSNICKESVLTLLTLLLHDCCSSLWQLVPVFSLSAKSSHPCLISASGWSWLVGFCLQNCVTAKSFVHQSTDVGNAVNMASSSNTDLKIWGSQFFFELGSAAKADWQFLK